MATIASSAPSHRRTCMAGNSFGVPSTLMRLAFDAASRRGDQFIGPEHLLLACAGAAPLRSRGVSADELRPAIDRMLGGGSPLTGTPGRAMLPTSDASLALRRAAGIA